MLCNYWDSSPGLSMNALCMLAQLMVFACIPEKALRWPWSSFLALWVNDSGNRYHMFIIIHPNSCMYTHFSSWSLKDLQIFLKSSSHSFRSSRSTYNRFWSWKQDNFHRVTLCKWTFCCEFPWIQCWKNRWFNNMCTCMQKVSLEHGHRPLCCTQ